MSATRVAVVTHSNPSMPSNGLQFRSHQMSCAFAKRYETHVFYPAPGDSAVNRSDCGFFACGYRSPWALPGHVGGFNNVRQVLFHSGLGAFHNLNEALRRFKPEITVVEFPYLFRHVRRVSASVRCRTILTEQNIEYQAHRAMNDFRWPAIYMVERNAVAKADAVIVVSREDAVELAETFGRPDAKIVPTGVDLGRYSRKSSVDGTHGSDPTDGVRLVLHGDFRHRPNRQALRLLSETILPRVWLKAPDTRLIVFGQGLHKREEGNIHYLGFVPDVTEILAKCDLAVVPILEASGVKTKILEYLAMGIPVITTTAANRGIGLTHKQNAFICDDVRGEFSSVITMLIEDRSLRAQVGTRGRQYAETHFSLERTNDLFLEALNS